MIGKTEVTRRSIRSRLIRSLVVAAAMLISLPVVSARKGEAFAEGLRFHAGIAVPLERLDAFFEKTVDNTAANTRVPEPRKGMVFHDEDSANTMAFGVGLSVGCDLPLAGSGLDLGGEVDIALHGGAAEGQLEGVGTSPGRNQLGESWPDHWSLERDRSYGFTLKLGGKPDILRSPGAKLYALAGIRRLEGRFATRFNGCMDPSPCSAGGDPDFVTGTDSRDLELQGWTAGIGMDKMLGQQLALRAEIRYTRYDGEDWTTPFDEVGVTVPASLEAGETGLSLRLARYF